MGTILAPDGLDTGVDEGVSKFKPWYSDSPLRRHGGGVEGQIRSRISWSSPAMSVTASGKPSANGVSRGGGGIEDAADDGDGVSEGGGGGMDSIDTEVSPSDGGAGMEEIVLSDKR